MAHILQFLFSPSPPPFIFSLSLSLVGSILIYCLAKYIYDLCIFGCEANETKRAKIEKENIPHGFAVISLAAMAERSIKKRNFLIN